jgi:hypothetical protein
MTSKPIRIEVGDIVRLTGQSTCFIVRELLADGEHAVCERTADAGPEAFFAASGASYSSYILALKDLVKR